jgi:DHA1 family tetracycline resistance protein-like MFS transporter
VSNADPGRGGPGNGRHAVRLAPILSVVFIGTLGFSVVLPFLVFLVIRLGGNAFAYGIIGSTYSALQLIGAPVLGRWSDRYGRRRILLLSQLGTVLSWALFLVALLVPVTPLVNVSGPAMGTFTLTAPLLLLFIARALDGLTGGNVSVANAYVADITAEEDRSASFGRMAVAQNLGFVAGPALAGLLGATGWEEMAPVTAALAISALALLVIAVRLPESRACLWVDRPQPGTVGKLFGQEQRDCHEVRGEQRPPLWHVVRLPNVGLLLVVHFLVYLAFNFFYVAFPVHAATGLGWSPRGVGFFFSYLSVLMVIVQGPVLRAVSRHAADTTLAGVGGIILAASFLLFAAQSAWVLACGAAILALGNGLMWPSLLSLLSKSAGPSAQGAAQGIAGSVAAVASITGLVAGGVIFEQLGEIVFVLAGLVAGMAWLACLGLGRPAWVAAR